MTILRDKYTSEYLQIMNFSQGASKTWEKLVNSDLVCYENFTNQKLVNTRVYYCGNDENILNDRLVNTGLYCCKAPFCTIQK